MPGAFVLRDTLNDASVFEYHVVGGHLARSLCQLLQSRVSRLHARVVQQDHIRQAPVLALVEIRRGFDVGDDEGIRQKCRHGPDRTGDGK